MLASPILGHRLESCCPLKKRRKRLGWEEEKVICVGNNNLNHETSLKKFICYWAQQKYCLALLPRLHENRALSLIEQERSLYF